MKVGIINVTGYSGMELARILHGHPEVEITSVTGRSAAGKRLGEAVPHLGSIDLTITEELTGSVDLVFSALPHAVSAERLGPILDQGVRAVDISADFRLRDPQEYREWYKVDHPSPQRLGDAAYGLPELYAAEVAGAQIVANPGCYPTAAILALAPAISAGLVETDLIVDAKSGVSGAGRGKYPYSEVNESVSAYSIGGHRHHPEIVQTLSSYSKNGDVRLSFTPHLVPMTRGILATCYAPLLDGSTTQGRVMEAYRSFYEDAPFVDVVGEPPMTKHTLGSNICIIHPVIDRRSGRLIVVGCLDNLVKGAAGQAVQNMNVMFGLRESQGLEGLALYP